MYFEFIFTILNWIECFILNHIQSISRLESARDDNKLRCEVMERDLAESQAKVDELSSLADETRMLKDEIDYLRSASDKAAKLEGAIEMYKGKLKELGDLRGQVKIFCHYLLQILKVPWV